MATREEVGASLPLGWGAVTEQVFLHSTVSNRSPFPSYQIYREVLKANGVGESSTDLTLSNDFFNGLFKTSQYTGK